jgi:hypothetical protein
MHQVATDLFASKLFLFNSFSHSVTGDILPKNLLCLESFNSLHYFPNKISLAFAHVCIVSLVGGPLE